MKKYIGLFILVLLQLLTIVTIKDQIGLESVLGLWSIIYCFVFYKKVFRLESDHSFSSSGYYDTVKGEIKSRNFNESNIEAKYSLKYVNTKWFYLTLAIINTLFTIILIKG